MKITEITIYGLSHINMGEANEADAAGYRAWLGEKLAEEFPDADINLYEEDRTNCYKVEAEDDEFKRGYSVASNRVQQFAEQCWNDCPWDWVG